MLLCNADSLLLTLVFLLGQSLPLQGEQDSVCSLAVERGHSYCDEVASQLRYYHDAETDICFPFWYNGCSGNNNSFASLEECYETCKTATMFRCIGNVPSTGECDRDMKGCPKGSYCFLGPYGSGICCDEKVEDQWLTEMKPKCDEYDYYPWDLESWNNTEKLIGRKCCHGFCPSGYGCVQGRHLAHCCKIKAKGKN